jgi:hypothetical protein
VHALNSLFADNTAAVHPDFSGFTNRIGPRPGCVCTIGARFRQN